MEVVTNTSRDVLENQEIYFNFINSLKSPVTKQVYKTNVKYYLKFCNLNKLSELLAIQEPQKQLIKYVMYLREKKLATTSINTMLYGIFHLYNSNDIILNKEKILSYKGEPTLKTVDRPYNYQEISRILNVSDLRMKCIVGLMFSGGLRIGAITSLKLRNLERVEQCYKVIVYEGSKEQYITFVSPEVTSFIDAYLQYRTQNGEKLTEQSHLIRDQFDINDIEQIRNKSKGIETGTLKHLLNLLLRKSGIRTVDHVNPHKRKEVHLSHGFRKFFTNALRKAHVPIEVRWLLEGRKLKGNDPSYVRVEVEEMFTEYQRAIDNLTINEENRLRKQVKILEVDKSRIDLLELSLQRLEQKYKKR